MNAAASSSPTVRDVLHAGMRSFLARPWLYLALFALAAAPGALLGLIDMCAMLGGGRPPIGALAFAAKPLSVLMLGAAVHASVATLDGRHATVSSSVAAAARRIVPLLAVAVLQVLAVLGASLLLIVPGIIAAVALCLAQPVALLERRGVIGSLRRAAALSRGHRWTLFGVGVVYVGVACGASVALVVPAGALALAIDPSGQLSVILGVVMFGIAQTVAGAVEAAFVGAAYHALRGAGPAGDP